MDLHDLPLVTMVLEDSSTHENSEGPTLVPLCPSTVDAWPSCPSTADARQNTPGSSPFFLSYCFALPNTTDLHRIVLAYDPPPPPAAAPPGQLPIARIVPVSFTHLTLPSISSFSLSFVA